MRNLIALSVAFVTAFGAAWAIAELTIPPPEAPWKSRGRREEVLWCTAAMSFLGLIGGVLGLERRRRGKAFPAALGTAALPALVSALLAVPIYQGAFVIPVLIGAGPPALLAATAAYFTAVPRPPAS